jgi:hypothetical protein
MTKEEKITLIHQQQNSGLSQVEFCAKKSIQVSAFRQWKYKHNKSHNLGEKFVELIPTLSQSMPIAVTIGRYRVEVPVHFDRAHLRSVLESLPC